MVERGPSVHRWLSERRRSTVSLALAVSAAAVLPGDSVADLSTADIGVFVLFAYLLPYLAMTLSAFLRVDPEQVRSWAHREARGTFMQRYVLGTAPGPGASLFIAASALVVAVLWLPGHLTTTFSAVPRTLVALALVVVAWVCVVLTFAVTFQADNLVENERALDFPGEEAPAWADYVYFALAAMTTFGTTDVNVTSRDMRRTVAANTVVAFVFNTVTVASLVSALGGR
ncbi:MULTISPECIES: DUF1345 domain-containing protein [Streptomyces]|uniref:DUF1345 domain-containing protein n=1 Tax=Streptomyces TaxID=1883 RepID=UPI00163CFA54|nr:MULTISPECIES: DUF1345 domain-containing protein [Streptomyces]MBC2879483.1 DUF1345 domain-containing protein [Streptomyces sp. TYQ1024]UBI35038.1 DUF1345 domain-containing protein [Streptomyces mobaraensis]UKW27635.1 DUF1345 domain-containing protein [Streptomyces sp. TYQ1024]UKW33366.1 DUF1345 domain-containing protein [Streptomyces sp. TYQ1024]